MIKKSLNEGVYFKDNHFVFNFLNDNSAHMINLKYAGKFIKRNNKKVYYSYVFKETADKEIKKQFLLALKYRGENSQKLISQTDYNKFLNKGINGLFHKMHRDIDIIVYPKSSAPLNNDIVDKLKLKFPYAIIANDVIVKNNIENIKIDTSVITDKTAQSILKSAGKNGELVVKAIPPMYRKYFSNFMKFDDKISEQLYKAMSGNVLLIDDLLNEGTTIKECEQLIRSLNATHIIKYVLLKT